MRWGWTAIGLICILGSQLANAQFISSFGVKGGVALSNQSYQISPINYTLDTEPILSPSLVFFAEAFQGDHFTCRPTSPLRAEEVQLPQNPLLLITKTRIR